MYYMLLKKIRTTFTITKEYFTDRSTEKTILNK